MQKFVFLVGVMSLTSPLFGFTKIELQCRPSVMRPDQGLSAVVYYHSPQIGSHIGSQSVTVTTQSIAGPQTVIRNRRVNRVVADRPGAPVRYLGTEFELSINFTVAPRPDRKTFATLSAVSDEGGQLEEELLCSSN